MLSAQLRAHSADQGESLLPYLHFQTNGNNGAQSNLDSLQTRSNSTPGQRIIGFSSQDLREPVSQCSSRNSINLGLLTRSMRPQSLPRVVPANNSACPSPGQQSIDTQRTILKPCKPNAEMPQVNLSQIVATLSPRKSIHLTSDDLAHGLGQELQRVLPSLTSEIESTVLLKLVAQAIAPIEDDLDAGAVSIDRLIGQVPQLVGEATSQLDSVVRHDLAKLEGLLRRVLVQASFCEGQ